MVTPIPISMNSYSPGMTAPIVPAPQAHKAPASVSAEDAMNVLKLVNIGKEVLDTSTLNKEPQVLVKIATGIIQTRKSGGPVEFANGRIHLSREVFDSIVKEAEGQANTASIGTPKLNRGAGQEQAPVPMIAPPPSAEKERRKDRASLKDIKAASGIKEEKENESFPLLSSSQAYCILVDIVPPGGGRYIVHAKERYEDAEDDRKELESGLEGFWKDFGSNISVNARHTSFTVQPRILIGGHVNSEVSKKLIVVYVSQSAEEKLKDSRILVSFEGVTLRPGNTGIEINFYSSDLIEQLLSLQTTRMDSGSFRNDSDSIAGFDKTANGHLSFSGLGPPERN